MCADVGHMHDFIPGSIHAWTLALTVSTAMRCLAVALLAHCELRKTPFNASWPGKAILYASTHTNGSMRNSHPRSIVAPGPDKGYAVFRHPGPFTSTA